MLVVLFTIFAAQVVAQISLGSFPSLVSIGEAYTLQWNATSNYTYNIWLIKDDSLDNTYDWSKVQTVASGVDFPTLSPSYVWTVPTNISVNDTYALWLNAGTIPFNGGTTSVATEWFQATKSKIPSSTMSTTPATGAPSGSDASDADKSHGSSGISGGAIAGIVVGVVVALALVGAALLVLRRRRGRSTVESREAEARAARLEPVMQEGYPSYEMNKTTSRA